MKASWSNKSHKGTLKANEISYERIFLILIGAFLVAWAVVQPLVFSPDEKMRYKVVDYIFRYGTLPRGDNPEVLDVNWGISYAFYPMLSYLPSVLFMKITSIFTKSAEALLIAARMAEVLYGVGTAYFTMKISKFFFEKEYRRMFLCLTLLMPGAFVLFVYVNCDALALLATAMLIYSWIKGMKEGWSYKSCILTAVGVAICAQSYYNAYGVIVATVVVFVLSILFCEEKRWNFKKMFQRGLFITGIVLVLAGWWFARNYVLYDGDILGLNITTECAEKNAAEERKPSNSYTFEENPDADVIDMMFYQPPWNAHNWIMMVYYSFIGSFGYMKYWVPEWIGKLFMIFFLFGIAGMIPELGTLFGVCRETFREKKMIGTTKLSVTYHYKRKTWNQSSILNIGLLITLIIPNVLNVYNSYVNDFQPQGRYSMPMILPLMYFMTTGYRWLFDKLDTNHRVSRIFCHIVCIGMIVLLVYCYAALFLPNCFEVMDKVGYIS